MIGRRDLLIAAGLSSFFKAIPALAQEQARKLPKIGVLWHAGNKEEEGEYFTEFQQGFRDLGYVEGQNFLLEHRFAGEQ